VFTHSLFKLATLKLTTDDAAMDQHLVKVESASWKGYQLLDSGEGEKLEMWGSRKVVRPEPKAIWRKREPALWTQPDAYCDSSEKWTRAFSPTTLSWEEGATFNLRMWQNSKHLGLFPEQEPHWRWISKVTEPEDRIANLFAYTGSASVVAAKAGARVTHVDASEPAVRTARSNASASGLDEAPIRWIVEDVMVYMRREQRRKSRYEGIMLDPPSFGRGPKGQLWKVEMVAELLDLCASVLSEKPRFMILTMYNLEASPLSLLNLMQPFRDSGATIEVGELALNEVGAERYLPMSLFARAQWK
jgi:23S rRNA (cytosine1962-C5)-methyltransferase